MTKRNKPGPNGGPNRPCKNLPNTATKAELMARHRAKMMGKFFRNLDPSYRQRGWIASRDHKGVL